MAAMLRTALAVAAALVVLAFGMGTYERWLQRRNRQYLAWTIALALSVIGAVSLAWGSEIGWSSTPFRLFYTAGAVSNVPFLAAGQVYLLVRRKTADAVFAVTLIVCAMVSGVVLAVPFIGELPRDRLPAGKEVFPLSPRIFAAVGSGGGAAVLVVGTVLGIVRIARAHRITPITHATQRMVGLGLLTLGTLILGASGLLNSVLGEMSAFAVTLIVGVSILFAGFLLSTATTNQEMSTSVLSD